MTHSTQRWLIEKSHQHWRQGKSCLGISRKSSKFHQLTKTLLAPHRKGGCTTSTQSNHKRYQALMPLPRENEQVLLPVPLSHISPNCRRNVDDENDERFEQQLQKSNSPSQWEGRGSHQDRYPEYLHHDSADSQDQYCSPKLGGQAWIGRPARAAPPAQFIRARIWLACVDLEVG